MQNGETGQNMPQGQIAQVQNNEKTLDDILDDLDRISQGLMSFGETGVPADEREQSNTPQADLGIGPIKYDFTLVSSKRDLKKPLLLLNTLVNLEKAFGDALLKCEASLLYAAFGKEDPISWLPSAQRLAIRRQVKKNIADYANQLQFTYNDDPNLMFINELIDGTDERVARYGDENPATIALISSFGPANSPVPHPLGTVSYPIVYRRLDDVGVSLIINELKTKRVRANATARLILKLLSRGPKKEIMAQNGDSMEDGAEGSAHTTDTVNIAKDAEY